MNQNWKKQITLFLTSQAVSLFGSSFVQFAIVWYVTKETSSGFWVSMLTVCAYLPQFLISFFAGVWADRHSKKGMIIAAEAEKPYDGVCRHIGRNTIFCILQVQKIINSD